MVRCSRCDLFSLWEIPHRVECGAVNQNKLLGSFNADTWSWVKIRVRQLISHFPIEWRKCFVMLNSLEISWKLNDFRSKTNLLLLQFESKSFKEREIIFCSIGKASANDNQNQNEDQNTSHCAENKTMSCWNTAIGVSIDRSLLIFCVTIFGFVTFIQFQIGILGKCAVIGVVFLQSIVFSHQLSKNTVDTFD